MDGQLGQSVAERSVASQMRSSAALARQQGGYAWATQLESWATSLENDPETHAAYRSVYPTYPLYPYYSLRSLFHPVTTFLPSTGTTTFTVIR